MEEDKVTTPSNDYGVSNHYLGLEGDAYFRRYSVSMAIDGDLTSQKFAPHIEKQHSVLDFGCGAGSTLLALNCNVKVGIDANPAARAAAQRNGIKCVESLEDVEDFAFDAVISNHVIEHIPHPLNALRQLGKKVKPSGVLLVCVPMDDWRSSKRFLQNNPDHHLYTWTPQTFGNLLTEAGFSVQPQSVVIISRAWPPHYARYYSKVPYRIFDTIASGWSILRHRRQILAVVRVHE